MAHQNLEALLCDHAFCEQKAASNAISLIVNYPQLSSLVAAMAVIAQEEMAHFAAVHQIIISRGWHLNNKRQNTYVQDLYEFCLKGTSKEIVLMERLLFAAMIEARSCERFRVLSQELKTTEPALASFYYDLMVSEAKHYTTFIQFARELCPNQPVDARWQAWLDYEAELMKKYNQHAYVHG